MLIINLFTLDFEVKNLKYQTPLKKWLFVGVMQLALLIWLLSIPTHVINAKSNTAWLISTSQTVLPVFFFIIDPVFVVYQLTQALKKKKMLKELCPAELLSDFEEIPILYFTCVRTSEIIQAKHALRNTQDDESFKGTSVFTFLEGFQHLV